jgi:hypothetical protein
LDNCNAVPELEEWYSAGEYLNKKQVMKQTAWMLKNINSLTSRVVIANAQTSDATVTCGTRAPSGVNINNSGAIHR